MGHSFKPVELRKESLVMKDLERIGLSSLSDEDIFEEIVRRIVNEHFKVFFSEERYYKVLSETFLQGFECDLDCLEPARCYDLEEDVRKTDEWLAFRRVYFELKGRPCHHPLEEILEQFWVACFRSWILPNHDESSVIDWILSIPLFSKNRTRRQIAELLGYISAPFESELAVTKQVDCEIAVDKLKEKKRCGPKKNRRTFRELLHVENDDERWKRIQKKLQELFDGEYRKEKERAQIIWILCKLWKLKNENLPSAPELGEAYNKASFSVHIEPRTFKDNAIGSIKEEFESRIRGLFKEMG